MGALFFGIPLVLVGCEAPSSVPAFAYTGAVVAVQGGSALALLDDSGALTTTLDLTSEVAGRAIPWMVHNVQITPDARSVLATAMPPMDADGAYNDVPDALVIVDLQTLGVRRCTLDFGLGAAHVVTDGMRAYITAYDQDRVVVVELERCGTVARWPLPAGVGPHGLRRSVDGEVLFVAGLDGAALLEVDTRSGDVTSWDLPGQAVQVAVLPDGSAVWVTLLDTRQVARLDLDTEEIAVFDLPVSAVGPAQIYPSPDSGSVWVADQGQPGEAAVGRELFEIHATSGAVLQQVTVDEAPHGVVVSADGAVVWATTLTFGVVARVDARTGARLGSEPVGDEPNGISVATEGGVSP